MAIFTAYLPQQPHFEGSFRRLLAPAPGSQVPAMSHPRRDMVYNHNGNYAAPVTTPSPSETRSSTASPVSSTTLYAAPYHSDGCYAAPVTLPSPPEARSYSVSPALSSTSYAAPYNAVPTHHANVVRTLPPSVNDPVTASGMYPRNPYPGFAHHHMHASQVPHTSLPSQFIHPQFAPPTPIHPPMVIARHPRHNHYGSYSVAPLPQQPATMWGHTHGALYPSLSTTSYHCAPAPSSYQTSELLHHASISMTPESPAEKNARLPVGKFLKALPPNVIYEILKLIGWADCWSAFHTSQMFRAAFDPHKLPYVTKLASLLDVERSCGHWDCEDSDAPKSKKGSKKAPRWLACYHCFTRKRFERFEQFKWGTSISKKADDTQQSTRRRGSTPAVKQEPAYTSPSPSSGRTPPPDNPHYDPTLTGSNLRASAASRGPHASPDRDGSSPRIKETWGIRRFCIECGLKKGLYRPGNLIEVQDPKNPRAAFWVCSCLKIFERSKNTNCDDCGNYAPLSRPT